MTTRAATARTLLALSFLAFVALGLPDGVLGVAWPSVRGDFALPLDALGALLVAATVGYVASSFASGWLLARLSVGTLLGVCCALTAASLLGYAAAPAWGVMVGCGVVAGLGAGAIDSGLNTFVAARHGARMLNLLHACYGVGTTAGPLLMTAVLMSGSSWRRGYAILGVAQVVLAVCFLATRKRWAESRRAGAPHSAPAAAAAAVGATLRLRGAWLGIASFFFYVGIEATAGAWIYSLLHQARGLPMATAGGAVSVYWGGLLAGRLVFGLAPEAFHPRALPSLAAGVAAGASGLLALAGSSATWCLAAAGLLGAACGPIFPALIASTPRRLGADHAANGVGFQIAASAIGQSSLPALVGVVARRSSLEIAPVVLAVVAIVLCAVLRALDRGEPARAAAGGAAVDAAAGALPDS